MEQWLDRIGLRKYAEAFAANDVDLDVLPEMSDADLQELGVSLGDRKRMLKAIRDGQDNAAPQPEIPIVAPPHLSAHVLRSRAALEGERKQVTVLFADIVGSTRMIAELDAEDAANLLRQAVNEMMAAVHQYEGTVNKVLGDGIMAIFGAPVAHEDHAIRACYAALAIQARMDKLAIETRQKYGVDVQVRQGLNSGDVVVRSIHNDLTMDYDAVGPTVHLAGRMEQIAHSGTCRLTHSTYRLVEGYVDVTSLGEIPVRGIEDPIEVFELHGAVDVRSRFLAKQRGRLTRFVGRDSEIGLLEQAWKRACDGHGQALSVVGEAGVGKSRLFHEFIHAPVMNEVLVLESGSVSHARAAAFRPLTDLLRAYLGIDSGDDVRRIREKTIGKLMTLDDSLRSIAAPVLSLLGAKPEDPAWTAMDPANRRRATLEACRTLLLREAQVQPLVVLFEDLHWIDAETQAFLDLMVDSVARAPILLLFNYRPEYSDAWVGKSYYNHVRIDPLPPASGGEMIADLLGDASELDALRQLIMDRTEGYPFYIEETVQGLVEEGVLEGERGAYRLTVPVHRITVPPTIQSVISARIDRLPADAKRLLQTASVIGKDFELTLLREVADMNEASIQGHMDEAAIQEHLATLQRGEFVFETQLFPNPEYTFKHALTHQVAYESILGQRRREMHAEILKAIERLHADHLDERLERLVYHGMLGEDWEAVHRHGMAAGHRALAMNAHRAAVEAFDNVLTALDKLPVTPERLRDAIDTRLALRDVLFVIGSTDRLEPLMEEALDLASQLNDTERLFEILLYQSGNEWQLGHYGLAETLAQRALDVAEQSNSETLAGLANYRLTTALAMKGNYAQAAETAVAGFRQMAPQGSTLMRFGGLVQTFVGSFGALSLAELGRFDEAEAIGRAAFETAVAANHAYSITVSCFGYGHALALRGKIDEATGPLEEGLRQIEVHSVGATVPWVAGRAAYVFAEAGRLQEMDEAIAQATGLEHYTKSMVHPSARIWIGRACLAVERADEAIEFVQGIVQDAPGDDQDLAVFGWAHYVLAEAARLGGRTVDAADAHLDAATAIAEDNAMRPLLALCLASRAGLDRDVDLAGRAKSLADEIGMVRWPTPLGALEMLRR